jgi:hypothetical protein
MPYALCPMPTLCALCSMPHLYAPSPMPTLYAYTLCPYSMLYVYACLRTMSCLMLHAIYVRPLHAITCIFDASCVMKFYEAV